MSELLAFQLKDQSVKIDDLVQEMCWALVAIFTAYRLRGVPLVITSGNDGVHKAHSARHPRSLHYENKAVDLRLPSRYTGKEATDAAMKLALASKLGPSFDVVLETDHIHVEYDPK